MVSIKDVAKLADVSTATVSRVLNNTGTVKASTTKKVLDAAKLLNYTPNLIARSFRQQKSGKIIIFVPTLDNPFYYRIISGISDVARNANYSAFIYDVNTHDYNDDTIQVALEHNWVDGIIFLFCKYDDLWLKDTVNNIPTVFCAERVQDMDIEYFGIDNKQAAFDVTNALLEMGHKRISLISSENKFISTKLRLEGFKAALKKHGIKYSKDMLILASDNYSFDSGYNAAKALLSRDVPPTAMFCISDTLALGALTAASDLNIDVPNRLSIWGFDNTNYSHMVHPYLSTVEQPVYEIGHQGMTKLLELMSNSNGPDKSKSTIHFLPHALIQRETTGILSAN